MFCRPVLVLAVCLACSPALFAADEDTSPAVAEFNQMYGEWKSLLGKFSQIKTRYQTDTTADKSALAKEAQEVMKKAKEMVEPLTVAGAKAFVAAPNQNKELNAFLVGAINGFIVADDFEIAAKISSILTSHQCDEPQLDYLAGISFLMCNQYDLAQQHLQAAKDKNAINEFGLRQLANIDKLKQAWAKESAIRAAEEKAGDLPKVKLTTTQGDIVVVLFENEAPNTTANFISLVESNFYDGVPFHRVIPGFMAQGGDPKGDGTGGPGYTIHDECRQENHRLHFRGSLSMAKSAAPDSGGSQFYITFVPTSHLDGKHTVFGRVVDGMRVLSKLQRTEGVPGKPGEPDKIIKATVLSKRPHEYEPIKRLDASN